MGWVQRIRHQVLPSFFRVFLRIALLRASRDDGFRRWPVCPGGRRGRKDNGQKLLPGRLVSLRKKSPPYASQGQHPSRPEAHPGCKGVRQTEHFPPSSHGREARATVPEQVLSEPHRWVLASTRQGSSKEKEGIESQVESRAGSFHGLGKGNKRV